MDRTELNFLFLKKLEETLVARKNESSPDKSYSAKLFNAGNDVILKKVAEECFELVIAAKNEDKNKVVFETADLLYHVLVLLVCHNISLEEITLELQKRSGISGLQEKANRNK